MAEDPFVSSFMNPNLARNGLYEMRMMSAANHMEPSFGRSRGNYAHQGMGDPMIGGLGQMANEPDYSQFTYDPNANAAARTALQPYGLAPLEANQVKQNVILPNTGFFGRHQRLSGALEGGIFGALAAHGGDTPGESIQGALEGLVGGTRIRQGLQRQQFARPFEAANMMEQMEDRKQRRDLQAADIEHFRALNEHLKNGDEAKAQSLIESNRHAEAMETLRGNQLEATAPRNLGGGLYGYYNPDGHGPNQKGQWDIEENYEAKALRQNAAQPNQLKGFLPDPSGKTGGKYITLAPGQTIPKGFQPMQVPYAERSQDSNNNKNQAAREKWIQRQVANPSAVWRAAGVQPGDKDMAQKLGKWYDQNFGPPENNTPSTPGFKQNADGSWSEN